MFQSYIYDLQDYALAQNESRFAAQQLLCLHRETIKRQDPIILELGVDRGPLLWSIFYKTGIKKQYQHSTQNNDSFLIDVTKYKE